MNPFHFALYSASASEIILASGRPRDRKGDVHSEMAQLELDGGENGIMEMILAYNPRDGDEKGRLSSKKSHGVCVNEL